jgi:hypothetical protein
MIIELNIFCLEQDQIANQELGLCIPLKDCITKKFGFLSIDYFSPRKDFPEYTLIGSSGEEFTCDDKYENVKLKIQEAQTFRFN